jgi:NhaA family Na+:H+ antiporter
MTIFFFVVGLEIRREMHDGELSDLRRAALPIAAALGGMVVPATIYAAVNHGRPTLAGWGVPMATDIAFAVGALTLLGRRAPPALRVLLLALAVVDDVGAIVVIALFYSAGIVGSGVAVAALGGAIVLVMQRLGVRSPLAYVAPGAVLWFGMLGSGIHPTLAGVVLGLLTPARTWLGAEGFATVAGETVEGVRSTTDSHEIAHQVATLRRAQREVLPPAVRLQHLLHPWVAFGIMPLFALANAGVRLEGAALEGDGAAIAAGVGLGLVVGKPLGVVLASWLALRMGVASLPAGLSVRGLLVVGTVAGIGFTMALFVAELAFGSGAELEVAKLAILGGSIASAVAGLVLGRTLLAGAWAPGTAPTERDAETSTTA